MLNADQNLESNLVSSIEAFLVANVKTPYDTAVSGTSFADPLKIIMDSPDDPTVLAETPVITISLPMDYLTPVSTGMGDRLVWLFKQFNFKCYPSLSQENDVLKPSIQATGYLRSLMGSITTALTLPLYDFSSGSPVGADGAYVTAGKIVQLRGAVSTLAIDKHRFDYELRIRFPILATNG